MTRYTSRPSSKLSKTLQMLGWSSPFIMRTSFWNASLISLSLMIILLIATLRVGSSLSVPMKTRPWPPAPISSPKLMEKRSWTRASKCSGIKALESKPAGEGVTQRPPLSHSASARDDAEPLPPTTRPGDVCADPSGVRSAGGAFALGHAGSTSAGAVASPRRWDGRGSSVPAKVARSTQAGAVFSQPSSPSSRHCLHALPGSRIPRLGPADLPTPTAPACAPEAPPEPLPARSMAAGSDGLKLDKGPPLAPKRKQQIE
mmetsp:Transcript_97069/g.280144  ORF Transcript_97069/g.280144 Transcript_97069/m.280144 type:complete len:259 (+) Transcript_97069:1415-2191(+)